MWFLLTFASVLFPWPVLAATFNCTQCKSTISWTDCAQNATVQDCSGKDGSFNACFRAELAIVKPANSTTFQQGCTTRQNFCTDWDTTNVTVRQCSLCPQGSPQEPCSARAGQLNAIDLGDGEQVEINVMVTKHPAMDETEQIVAKAPNGQPIVFLFMNNSANPSTEWRHPVGPPKVIDFSKLPGSYEIFPYGWNETVTGGAERVGFEVCFTVLVAIITIAVTNYC
ncbi:uncharacterized protein LOC120413690 [Culex pipiens pallens]|uniref:uncharacterized protein LOC120413690 n=1 Tax=Culex pipiens pallens TaxID=42434 RepID=UPI0019545F26|nr:uncharacterized protein LOC120413690 [Culex pipiens pallens]